ncbi:MAG: TonB-dependent receptor [Bacteroidales bacterium]
MDLNKRLLAFVLLFQCLCLYGQTIKGTVRDEASNPIVGVVIISKFNSTSAISDEQGKFSLSVKSGNTSNRLVFRSIGYEMLDTIISPGTQDVSVSLKNDVNMLSEVLVTTKSINKHNTSVMDAEEIGERNYGKDVTYLLESQPSVVVTSDAGNGVGYTGIRIRGGDVSSINVSLNGVPINDQESQGVFFVNMPDLASSLSSVEVHRGVTTASNSRTAFGAGLGFNTDGGEDDFGVSLDAAYGSFNTSKLTLRVESGAIADKWTNSLRVSNIQSDGYVDRASSDLNSVLYKTSYNFGKSKLGALYMFGKEKTYQTWDGISPSQLDEDRRYNPAGEIKDENGDVVGFYDNHTDNYKQHHAHLYFDHELFGIPIHHKVYYVYGEGYFESYKNNKKLADYNITSAVEKSNLVKQEWLQNNFYGYMLDAKVLEYNTGSLNFSLHANKYDGDHFGKVIWVKDESVNFNPDDKYYLNTGVKKNFYATSFWKQSVGTKLDLTASLQYRHVNYTIKGILDDGGRDVNMATSYDFFDPGFGLNYNLSRSSDLSFSVALAHREPSRSTFVDAGGEGVPKAEKLLDYELGYHYRSSKMSVNANAFYMDYSDQLVMSGQLNDVGAYIMKNVDNSYRLGLELYGTYQPFKFLSWRWNLTLSDNVIQEFDEYIDNWDTGAQEVEHIENSKLSFSPSVVGGSAITVEPVKTFKIILDSKYVGKQYLDNTESDERSLDAYFVNNLIFSYEPTFLKVPQLALNFAINNITNEMYVANGWTYRYMY